ncbi:MAG: hypothetical protein WCY80_01085 [Candidatus Izemoplasmatales bacterium]
MKILRRLLIVILILVALVALGVTVFINRIKVNVTADELPQDVYEANGDYADYMRLKGLEMISADEEEQYSLIEEFLNYLILDIIKEDINTEYAPLDGETETEKNIVNHDQFNLDFIYAHQSENDQIVVTVSVKRSDFPEVMTAFNFYFDVEYSMFTLTLSLDKVFLADMEVKYSIYDYFVSLADKDALEDYVTDGTLDLDNYTYTINFLDVYQ